MKRRWIIRAIFIALLTLSVTGWVVSVKYLCSTYVNYGGYALGAVSLWGTVNIRFARETSAGGLVNSWYFKFERQSPNLTQVGGMPGTVGDWRGGFYYKYLKFDFFEDWVLTIPYWFIVPLFAALLWFVWRKTRETIDPRTAFPVELNPTPPPSGMQACRLNK